MLRKQSFTFILAILVILPLVMLPRPVQAAEIGSAADLIAAINAVRAAQGNPPLEVSNILMATAQATAETMAAGKFCSHIGNVSGRVAAAGYGSGAKVWATENISCGPKSVKDVVYTDWTDPDHMWPMTYAAYKHIGAGVADVNGYAYYVVQAAYTSGGSNNSSNPAKNSINQAGSTATPQLIIPVVTVTPQKDGSLIHEVQPGQTLWAIAIAYGVKIADLVKWNNLSPNSAIYVRQKLVVAGTPTATLSPTITNTRRPITRTPTLTKTPRPPTGTPAPTLTPTPTTRPVLPPIPALEAANRRWLGIGLIAACAAGLLFVLINSFKKK
jgi:LysM repeat protein